MRKLEFLVGLAFLLGPMVYVLTLPTEEAGQCEANTVVVELIGECLTPGPQSEPAPVLEPPATIEPVPALVDEPSVGPLEFAFVVGDGRYVVLADDVDESWGTGEFFEPVGEVEKRVGKRADLDRVGAGHRAQIGRTFDVYDDSGKECSAKIERLLVIAQFDWGLEGLGLEEHSDPETDEMIEPDHETIQQAVWTTQPRWLVGEFDDDCGSLWARDAALPAPTILTFSREPSPTTRARLAQFERDELPMLRTEYEASRSEHEKDPDAEFEDWDVSTASLPLRLGAWLDALGVPHFVTLDYGHDDSPCDSDHDIGLEAFDAVEDGVFEPTDHSIDVAAIFDVDLDGRFETLSIDPPDGYHPKHVWARVLWSSTDELSSVITVMQEHSGCEC